MLRPLVVRHRSEWYPRQRHSSCWDPELISPIFRTTNVSACCLDHRNPQIGSPRIRGVVCLRNALVFAAVRIVSVAGGPCPCGGTHVRNTRELGRVQITKVKSKKNTIRVSYQVGAVPDEEPAEAS
jgi:hypothetical protein